jgi:hypothetical protein
LLKLSNKNIGTLVALIYTMQRSGGIMEIAILLLSVVFGGSMLAGLVAYMIYVSKINFKVEK